jgi:hypothetical protein
LVKLACDRPPKATFAEVWTQQALSDELRRQTGKRVSRSTVQRVLSAEGLRPHRVRQWLHSPDPKFREKVARVCDLYLHPPPGSIVVCIDEKPMQALTRKHPSTRAPDARVKREFEYVRHGTCSLLASFDVATGEEKAAVPIDGPTGTTPAVLGDRVFFGTEGGVFFGIDVVKAEVVWRVAATAAGQSYRSSAAIADGLALVGFRGKAIEAFSTTDGTRAWKRPMRGRVEASPAVVAATGPDGAPARAVAIVADSAGRVAAVEATSGEPVWEFDAGGGFGGGAAVAADRVVLASDDGILWCFRSGD